MSNNHSMKAGVLALVMVFAFLVSWELYWRSQGYSINYDDGKVLWADKRARVYEPSDKTTVFIGSSRIKFDLDIPTWERLTGDEAVQLAMEGNSPLPILEDLAADEKFKGKLVIDVTEGLFFAARSNRDKEPGENIQYYKERTPSQKASFQVSRLLESRLVMLDQDYLSLNGLLDRCGIPPRAGVFQMPYFPPEFSHNTFDRQSIIQPRFLTDTNLQKQVTGNWLMFAEMAKKQPPPTKDDIMHVFNTVRDQVAKIRSRGGQVIFVRTPSSGPFWEMESKVMPREKLWDPLLAITQTPGIHFKDHPETSNYSCPEWSHLAHKDAIDYTRHLVNHIEQKGWQFRNKPASLSFINH